MNNNYQRLTELLEIIYQTLASCKETHWRNFINKCLIEIKNKDFHGVELFCSSNGGMASLNDLVIHPMNNHKININEVNSTNELLQKHISEAFKIAQQIKFEFYSTKE